MIKVDENTCIGCGACVAIDSEHFDFNEAGLSVATAQDVTDSVKEAADACPVGAITYEEGATPVAEATEEAEVVEETEEVEEELAA